MQHIGHEPHGGEVSQFSPETTAEGDQACVMDFLMFLMGEVRYTEFRHLNSGKI